MCDLIYWGLGVVAGWKVEQLPADALINFWVEMQQRYCTQINAQNHATAYMVDIDQATKEKRKKLKPSQWMPFNLTNGAKEKNSNKPYVSTKTTEILKFNRDIMPIKMLVDLYKYQIIEPD